MLASLKCEKADSPAQSIILNGPIARHVEAEAGQAAVANVLAEVVRAGDVELVVVAGLRVVVDVCGGVGSSGVGVGVGTADAPRRPRVPQARRHGAVLEVAHDGLGPPLDALFRGEGERAVARAWGCVLVVVAVDGEKKMAQEGH